MLSAEQLSIYNRAVSYMAAVTGATTAKKPVLFDAHNKPLLPTGEYRYQRSAARRTGSMKNWLPRRLTSREHEALEREALVARSVDLVQNDPHAAGAVDGYTQTVIGSGLVPQPMIDHDYFAWMTKEESRLIQTQMRSVYKLWAPFADAGGRMTAGEIQFLLMFCMLQYGEYICLLPMLDDPARPYSLAVQVINPLRVKTPDDLRDNSNIRDGVELGEYGEAKAYWIKRSDPANSYRYASNVSDNFLRVPVKQGHRLNAIHGFICKEPEQIRGVPIFASGMKFFRDFSDLLDAELVSNIVTAAFSMFVEVQPGTDPASIAGLLTTGTEQYMNADGHTSYKRYQEMIPGQIMYGNTGEKPHTIAGDRPGTTFEPFTKIIKKALSMSMGVPYPVLFKDVEGVNFAGFRSALLDAWRVYTSQREIMGNGYCQPVFTMLMEEAWLMGQIDADEFYSNMWALTRADWRGSPKGDIEPIKAAKADILLIQNNLKSRGEAIAERGGDKAAVFEELQEEEEILRAKGLDPEMKNTWTTDEAAEPAQEEE